ncbi:MAG TPA: hypothetical protein VGM72_00410 [Micropepsaceae bacterium]|jgi:hypothetical protein
MLQALTPVLKPAANEPTDISGLLMAYLAISLIGTVVGLSLLLRIIFPSARDAPPISSLADLGGLLQLQIDEAGDFQKLRRAEDESLNSYGWINRNDKHIRIPIRRAMELTAKRGIPGWPTRR